MYYNENDYGAPDKPYRFKWGSEDLHEAVSLGPISKQRHVPRPSVQTIDPKYKVH